MKSVLAIIAVAIAFIAIGFAFTPRDSRGAKDPRPQDKLEAPAEEKPEANPEDDHTAVKDPTAGAITAVVTIEGRGDITLALYPKAAPKTVAHVAGLMREGFYDGVLFHRVVPGFVAQVGDPASKGLKAAELAKMTDEEIAEKFGLGGGGSGKPIAFESNVLKHQPYTVAMALNAPRSATGDSQFFINLVENTPLNGDYCVFGKVVQGEDVVRKIQRGDKIARISVK
jgi:cyclophilin family peptidyl-prolyl cis-trans isomerase